MYLHIGVRDMIYLHTVAEQQRTKAQTQSSNWAAQGQPLLVLTQTVPWGHPGPCPGQTSIAGVLAHTKHKRTALGQTSRHFDEMEKFPQRYKFPKLT